MAQWYLRWYHTDLVVTTFSTFLFFKNVGEMPSFLEKKWEKKTKKTAKFGRFRSFSFTILAQLRVIFAQVCLWFRFNSCDLFKVRLISSTFRFNNYMLASHVPSTWNCAKVRTFTYFLVCYYVYWTGWNNSP